MSENYNDSMEKFRLPDPPVGIQLLISVLIFLFCGFAIKYMWLWFVTPLGLPAITFAHAIGIDIFVTFIVTTRLPINNEENLFWFKTFMSFFWTLCTFLIALLVQLFV